MIEKTCSLCGATCHDLPTLDREWDWFTGYLEKTFVACPDCLRERPADVSAARMKSQQVRPIPLKGRPKWLNPKSRIILP